MCETKGKSMRYVFEILGLLGFLVLAISILSVL